LQFKTKSLVFISLALTLSFGSLVLSSCQGPIQKNDQTQIPDRLRQNRDDVSKGNSSHGAGGTAGGAGMSATSATPSAQVSIASAAPNTGAPNTGAPNTGAPNTAAPNTAAPSGSPPGAETSGGANFDRPIIKVSEEAAAQVDLKTEVIGERDLVLPLNLTGHIEPDNGGDVDVSSRIAGRITQIFVKPGEKVSKGHLLAMIESREVAELEGEMLEAKSKLDISMAHAERERQVYEEQIARPKALLDAKAKVAHDKVHLELAESEFHRVDALYKEKIAAGKDFVAAKARMTEAKLEMDQAQTALLREQHLYDDRVLMKKDYQVAMAEVTREKQHLSTIIKRLEFIGADRKLTSQVLKSGALDGLARLVAPVDGVVNHYEFATGEMVHPDNSIFKLTDLRNVQVSADLPEADLQRVKIGDHVKIKVSSYPHATFEGTINLISQHVHLQTLSIPIRARLANPGGKLKPNMYAEIDVANTSVRGLACPKAAVHDRGRHKIVFVKKPGGFEERIVKLEPSKSQFAEVLEGLKAGEEVATEGSQSLMTRP
jgi:cobalt-zinc-cadmium efflux system membrane fusion protein